MRSAGERPSSSIVPEEFDPVRSRPRSLVESGTKFGTEFRVRKSRQLVRRRSLIHDDAVAERPPALARLDSFLAASVIAHEATFDLHRELAELGRVGADADELLVESARLTLRELPRTVGEARRLAATWRDQSMLDPAVAATTLEVLVGELDRIEPAMRDLLKRQREIAERLRSMLE